MYTDAGIIYIYTGRKNLPDIFISPRIFLSLIHRLFLSPLFFNQFEMQHSTASFTRFRSLTRISNNNSVRVDTPTLCLQKLKSILESRLFSIRRIGNQRASFEAGLSVILGEDEKYLSAVSWITLRRSETVLRKFFSSRKKKN